MTRCWQPVTHSPHIYRLGPRGQADGQLRRPGGTPWDCHRVHYVGRPHESALPLGVKVPMPWRVLRVWVAEVFDAEEAADLFVSITGSVTCPTATCCARWQVLPADGTAIESPSPAASSVPSGSTNCFDHLRCARVRRAWGRSRLVVRVLRLFQLRSTASTWRPSRSALYALHRNAERCTNPTHLPCRRSNGKGLSALAQSDFRQVSVRPIRVSWLFIIAALTELPLHR